MCTFSLVSLDSAVVSWAIHTVTSMRSGFLLIRLSFLPTKHFGNVVAFCVFLHWINVVQCQCGIVTYLYPESGHYYSLLANTMLIEQKMFSVQNLLPTITRVLYHTLFYLFFYFKLWIFCFNLASSAPENMSTWTHKDKLS